MENGSSRRCIASMRQSLFDEGILDRQFTVLEQLQDRDNPNFIEEVVTVFINDSTTELAAFEQEMDKVPIDLPKMDRILHRLKGGSASIGARKVRNEVNKTWALLQEGNLEGTRVAFQDLRNEHGILKTKLERYIQQLRHARSANTASPPR